MKISEKLRQFLQISNPNKFVKTKEFQKELTKFLRDNPKETLSLRKYIKRNNVIYITELGLFILGKKKFLSTLKDSFLYYEDHGTRVQQYTFSLLVDLYKAIGLNVSIVEKPRIYDRISKLFTPFVLGTYVKKICEKNYTKEVLRKKIEEEYSPITVEKFLETIGYIGGEEILVRLHNGKHYHGKEWLSPQETQEAKKKIAEFLKTKNYLTKKILWKELEKLFER